MMSVLSSKSIWNKNYLFKRALAEVIFFVTNRCNLRCPACFYRQELNIPSADLGIAEIEKVFKTIGPVKRVLLSGGEIYLRPDISEIVRTLRNVLGLRRLYIPTNGYDTESVVRQTTAILDKNKDLKLAVSLSLDGLANTHDLLKGVPGSFERLECTNKELSLLRKTRKFALLANTVVSTANYAEIPRLCSYIKDRRYRFDYHGFAPVRGELRDPSIQPLSGTQWLDLQRYIFEYQKDYYRRARSAGGIGFFRSGKAVYDAVVARSLDGKPWPFRCQAGKLTAVLEPDGRVRLCELTDVIGNVKDYRYDFMKVLNSESARRMSDRIEDGDCSKGCTHGCFLEPSLRSNPLNVVKVLFGRG